MLGLAGATLAFAAFAAQADAGIIFAGSTFGQFDAPVQAGQQHPQPTAVLGGMTFTGSTFSVEEEDGFAAVGSIGSTQNFGTIALTTSNFNYNLHSFLMQLELTLPENITSGNNPTNFTANVYGKVQSNKGGGSVLFFDASETYCFNDPLVGSGDFTIFIDNVNITPGLAAPITGRIFVNNFSQPLPEPASLGLLGLGALSLLRRRR